MPLDLDADAQQLIEALRVCIERHPKRSTPAQASAGKTCAGYRLRQVGAANPNAPEKKSGAEIDFECDPQVIPQRMMLKCVTLFWDCDMA